MNVSLQTLPAELIWRIFDHLDAETIVFAVRCACKRLYTMTNCYDRYALDFRFTSLYEFHVMQKIINPKNVITLTLMQRWYLPSLCNDFVRIFNIDQFTRLRSLTIDADSYQLLNWLEESTIGSTLTTLNININTDDPSHFNRGENWLAPIVSKYTLRKLHINEHCLVMGPARLLVHKTQWPIDYPLKSLAISYATPNIFCIICNQLPNLQILIVQSFSGLKILEVAEKPADSKPLLSLTSLSLLSINMADIEELKSLLSLVPNLTHFRINAMSDLTDSFYDGTQWEEIIRAKLPLLDHFTFCFEHYLLEKPKSNIVEEHIAKFQTKFWLETKSLLVQCALESENNGHRWKLYLHSIPISEDNIEYYSDGKQIIHSAVNKIDHNLELFINIKQLILFIGQIPDTIASEGTRSCQSYLFPRVRKLTLVINEKWPIGTIQYLQNTFETNLGADMRTLFEHTLNLRSLIINCNQSEQMNLTTYNSICLKLPQSVKYLSAHITHVEDAQRLLEKVNNLSRVTFQMIPCESSFMDDIKERLLQAGIYVRLEMERDDICSWIERDEPDEVHCYPVHLWLEKRYQDIID
ncbi:unnamed protein product [Rotaria magnacalcarata]|uniref:F-box domain-containing protein n=2 Tax=Rotaria magnacalcarata TaxID=392030 RepID=A0A816XHS0_9BILA|nr:unnamed protein product [Rotaria magnacalcarata]